MKKILDEYTSSYWLFYPVYSSGFLFVTLQVKKWEKVFIKKKKKKGKLDSSGSIHTKQFKQHNM